MSNQTFGASGIVVFGTLWKILRPFPIGQRYAFFQLSPSFQILNGQKDFPLIEERRKKKVLQTIIQIVFCCCVWKMFFGDIILFSFCLLDTGVLLFILIFFIITLSDLECDYLNAQECCARLNFVSFLILHFILVYLC